MTRNHDKSALDDGFIRDIEHLIEQANLSFDQAAETVAGSIATRLDISVWAASDLMNGVFYQRTGMDLHVWGKEAEQEVAIARTNTKPEFASEEWQGPTRSRSRRR